jgi:hypothetical protein
MSEAKRRICVSCVPADDAADADMQYKHIIKRRHRSEWDHSHCTGGGEEEPRSDASSQVESDGSEPPPPPPNLYGVAVQCLFCRYYLFPVILVVTPIQDSGLPNI